jgi:hypothetical protein
MGDTPAAGPRFRTALIGDGFRGIEATPMTPGQNKGDNYETFRGFDFGRYSILRDRGKCIAGVGN